MGLRVLAAVVLWSICTVLSAQELQPHEFTIGSGEVISIQVYNEPDLTVRTRVDSSGQIRMPLIGNLIVINKSTDTLAAEIEAALFDGYLVNPQVTVNIEEFRPIFVKGAVKLPGAYDFTLNLNVDQAIAIAGGLKDRASRKNWYIVRGEQKQRTKVTRESVVLPGDILEIEESIF